jgi:hypothetical protein
VLAALAALTACNDKGTLDRTQVEYMRVDGRRFEVRVTPADDVGVYRLLVVRATLVIDPDPEAERSRGWNVARQVMDRTCKGRPYQVLEDNLVDNVNLYTRFRCAA